MHVQSDRKGFVVDIVELLIIAYLAPDFLVQCDSVSFLFHCRIVVLSIKNNTEKSHFEKPDSVLFEPVLNFETALCAAVICLLLNEN